MDLKLRSQISLEIAVKKLKKLFIVKQQFQSFSKYPIDFVYLLNYSKVSGCHLLDILILNI
jgi:hypothetical protein